MLTSNKYLVQSPISRLASRYAWLLSIVMLLIAVGLVILGIIQFLLGNEKNLESMFYTAKYLGLGGAALGSISTLWKYIKDSFYLFRIQHAKGHIVICGLSAIGQQLVDLFLEKGDRVVIIEENVNHPSISGYKARGILVLNGNAADSIILQQANIENARFLFAVLDSDTANIDISHESLLLIKNGARRKISGRLRCFAHVHNPVIKDFFLRHDVFAIPHNNFDAKIFNIYEESARIILAKYPPDLFAHLVQPESTDIRMLVLGFGECGENIVKQAARICHFAHGKKLKITIAERNISDSKTRFLSMFGDGASFIVPDVSLEFCDISPAGIISLVSVGIRENTIPDIVYAATDDDSRTLADALRIRNLLGVAMPPIIACLSSNLSDSLQHEEFPNIRQQNIIPFNIVEYACTAPVLLDEVIDEIAREIHQAYVDSQREIDNTSAVEWDNLPEYLKDSNRWQADHLMIKLRELGYDRQGLSALESGEPCVREMLAELEHRRWNAALFMDGWRYAPGKKDSVRKLHPCLVPYDELPANEKAKDDTAILNIRNLVRKPGFTYYRKFIGM